MATALGYAGLAIALVASGAVAEPRRTFVDEQARVRLTYPASLRPETTNILSNYFNPGGWRMSWNGQPVGPGTVVVAFQDGGQKKFSGAYDDVGEYVQVGMSRDPSVVATCGTAGLEKAGERLPNRRLGGHRWTVYRDGDAGMSQSVLSYDYRTVVDGVCYAITRLTYTGPSVIRAGLGPIRPVHFLPPAKAAAARMDAILASIRVGRPR